MSTGRLVLHRHFLPTLAAIVFLALLAGSDAGSMQKSALQSKGRVLDWSANHILYPQGTSLRTLTLGERDPRAFWNYLRLMAAAGNPNGPGTPRRPVRPILPPRVHVDWSVSLGGTAGMAADMYPAKFNFDIAGNTPSCANDYAVYTIDAAGSATQANIVAFNNLYSGTTSATTVTILPTPTGAKELGTTVTITTLTAHGFVVNETVTVAGVGVAGYNGTWVVTSVPTTTTFTYTDTASGLVASGGGTAAEGGSSCGTNTAPTVNWAYNIAGVALPTSPIISYDATGSKVAFVDGANPAVFHVLTWTAGQGTVGAPATPSAIANVTLTGATTDTNSSPFMEYGTDTAFVGTDNGLVFKISPVFGGTPPASVSAFITIAGAPKLTGPVLDFSTGAGGNILVGGSNGDLYGFTPAGAAITSSPLTVGNGGTDGGIVDAPIVDAVNHWAYVASGNNGTTNIVTQASTSSFAAANVFTQTFGGHALANVHAGAFNNAYFTSGTSTTWFLYVCGSRAAGAPGFYQIGFNATRHIASVTDEIHLTANAGEQCSPLTEFENNGVDQIFLGLRTTAEVAFVNITTPPPTAITTTAAEAGGTSGIIVDNSGTGGQESSIYFSRLATSTCATSAIAAAAGGATEATNTVTITTTAAHGFGVGESVTIAGVGVAGYNGTYVVTSVPSSTKFTYTDATAGLANSGGGTATASGFCAVKVTQGALQ